ncbi:MAG: hypothetical protein Fues2KO_50160 [Fuerstiella sp.]
MWQRALHWQWEQWVWAATKRLLSVELADTAAVTAAMDTAVTRILGRRSQLASAITTIQATSRRSMEAATDADTIRQQATDMGAIQIFHTVIRGTTAAADLGASMAADTGADTTITKTEFCRN